MGDGCGNAPHSQEYSCTGSGKECEVVGMVSTRPLSSSTSISGGGSDVARNRCAGEWDAVRDGESDGDGDGEGDTA